MTTLRCPHCGAQNEAPSPDAALLEACKASKSILWMAEKYAEGGGSRSIEMEDYQAAASVIRAAIDAAEGALG